MRRILITGGAGFIGSSLADELLKDDNTSVTIVDNLLTGKTENIPNHENCKFVHCDVNDYTGLSAVMTSSNFDYVFHYAAVVGVKRTLDNPLMVLDDIQGIKNILELSKNTSVKRIFYASSSEVYGEPVELPQNEATTPLNSRLPYSIVKNLGEAYCKSYFKQYDLDYTIFRFFNTYGPKQSNDFVINKFIEMALENKDITIHGDGLQTRTFCHVQDNVDATITMLENDLHVNDVVNLGSDIAVTIKELAEAVIQSTGSISNIEHLAPLPEGDMRRRQPDISKMNAILQRDLMPLKDGLEKCVEHFVCKKVPISLEK